MRTADLVRLKTLIRSSPWKKSTSEEYKDAPHSYLIVYNTPKPVWRFFKRMIREHGEMRSWRGNRARYLIHEKLCYWIQWPALNRADVRSLDPLPKGTKGTPK